MDFSKIIDQYSSRQVSALSIKEDSAVYTVKNPDGGLFVLRIYDRPMDAYQLLAGQDDPDRTGGSGGPGDPVGAGGWEHPDGGNRPNGGSLPGGWGLPRVYSCRMEQGCCVVEEEYIDGISLQELIDGGEKMSAQRAVSITSSLCRTLLHLHRKGIIHRDVKPEHVMLTPEGKLYLIDLDAAMRILPDKKSDTRLLGTAVYAAPEQFGLTRSDVRTDVFAVGILLNLLLTGEHPAVVRCREGKLAEIIGKCTEMNPQDRYQDMTELLAALEDAAAEARAESEGMPGGKKRLAIMAALCLVILIGAALVLGMDLLTGGHSWEDGVSEAVLELDDSAMADEKYIICTKTEENHYVPLPVSRNGYAGNETPAMFFLGEYTDRTFYLLSRNQAERLELRILDSRRYMTLEKAAAAVTRKGNVLAGGQEYAVWQVKIDEDFAGAVRMGFSFNGVLANYDTEGGSGRQTKYMWILDEDCQRYDFSDGYDGSLIPCAENPAGQRFDSISAMEASGVVLSAGGVVSGSGSGEGAQVGGPLTKEINISLTPYDDANAFYLVHPLGTAVQDDARRVFACDQDGSGFDVDGARGGVFAKSAGSIFTYVSAGTVVVGDSEMQVTKVNLKEYGGHQEIAAKFTLTAEKASEAEGTSVPEGFAGVRFQMGMNIVVLGAKQWGEGVLTIDSQANLLEKAAGFTPETPPLEFKKSGDRYEGFYPQACAQISDEGQGRMISLNVAVSQDCRIEDITDGNGKPLAYIAEKREWYALLDEDGNPIYDEEEISARGWRSGISGTTGGTEENRCLMDVSSCVKVRKEDYARDLIYAEVGSGSTPDLQAFLEKKDAEEKKNRVELRASYLAYTIYFDPADDAARNEIVFRIQQE